MSCRAGFVILFLAWAASAFAIDIGEAFDDPELQARYEKLIAEVRCVTCQNQSIKDSNAFLASDLRREIRRLMEEGKSNAEISEFLVTRYGDFALYRPRFAGKTLFLWIPPFLFAVLGGIALIRIIRYRIALPIDDDEANAGSSS